MYSGRVKKSASWAMHMKACAAPVKLRPRSRFVIDSSYATMRQKCISVIALLAFEQPRLSCYSCHHVVLDGRSTERGGDTARVVTMISSYDMVMSCYSCDGISTDAFAL